MIRYPIEPFLEKISDRREGGFRFCENGRTTLLSSCFAVQLCYLLDRQALLDRHSLAERIAALQQPDGTFVDAGFSRSQLIGRQSDEYLKWQFTFFALAALDMLEVRPVHENVFLRDFQDPDFADAWLMRQDFDDFWYGSNIIMFLLFFLAYEREKGNTTAYDGSLARIFACLDQLQDGTTGFWGKRVQVDPTNGMYGAAHIYLFYDYFEKPIGHVPEIIESTLRLQHHNGLYGGCEGGACEDYDGVEILVRTKSGASAAARGKINDSLRRTYAMLLRRQNPSGGFSYRIASASPGMVLRRIVDKVSGRLVYRFSGWEKMACNPYVPDIWATYFRFLTIAQIETTLDLPRSYDYRSSLLPSWGYLGRKTPGNERK